MNTDTNIIATKTLRRDIDAIIQRLTQCSGDKGALPQVADQPDEYRRSRERSLALTKLQEAVMWLGMDLKAMNEEQPGTCANPYPDSKDPSNTIINPTADSLKL